MPEPASSPRALLIGMAGSARLAHALATVGIGLAAGALFLQRTLGWAGFLAAVVVALVLMLLSYLARQDEIAWRSLLPVSLLVFLVWAAVSLVWSDYKWATVGGLAYLLAFTLIALFVAISRDTIQIVRAFGDVLRVALGASLGIEVFSGILIDAPLPFLGVHGALGTLGPISGIEPSRDQLGLVAIIGAISFATEHRTRSVPRLVSVLSLILAGLCIVLTQSPVIAFATIVVGIAAAVIYGVRRVRPERRQAWQFAVLGLAVAASVLLWVFRSPVITLFNASGTLDFRIDLWRRVIDLATLNGLQGWGWVGPWRTEIFPFSVLNTAVRPTDSALNAFLDIWLQLGAVGVVIFLGMVGLAFSRSWLLAGARRSVVYAWPAAALVALIIVSLAESSILSEFGWMTFVICCTKASQELSWRSALRSASNATHLPPERR
ncbi:O-antigen ligase family protein [Lysinimonas soli]|uniref:O-antigen ligase family protein n=1 Tax=Lysinimonas soli TaxID=1074233 RepID=A0ABW0NTU1_9MICO